MNRQMTFGILGCGMIAHIHAAALLGLPQAQLLGAADADQERAKAFAQKYGIRAWSSPEAMLADPEVDAVCICTPSGFHAENALAALAAGRHVVLEKPMALTVEDTEAICAACKTSGRLLTVISQNRFEPDVARLKGLLEQNAFGRLIFCDLQMKYWRSEDYYSKSGWKGTRKMDGGGALMNQGIHGVDLLQYLVGEPRLLRGEVRTRHHAIEVEDTAAALLEFPCGALGVIEASTCTPPGAACRIELRGDRGGAVLEQSRLTELILDGEPQPLEQTENRLGIHHDPTALEAEMHRLQITNLIRAAHGEEPLLMGPQEGQKAIRLIRDIYASSEALR